MSLLRKRDCKNYKPNFMRRRVILLKHRCSLSCLGVDFDIRVEPDCKNIESGRIFIQIVYDAVCSKTGKVETWHGRKWYLSEYMTDDEIIKTIYAAFEAAIKHEILEGFKVDGKILFNPHVNFEELLKISDLEIQRQQK